MAEPITTEDRARMLQLIGKFTGPAPWYLQSFPEVKGCEWIHHGNSGPLAHLVTLNELGRKNDPLLALNIYCTPFLLPDGKLGIWHPDGRKTIRLLAFDLAQLKHFPLEEIAGWFGNSGDSVYSVVAPLADFEFNTDQSEGTHPITVPAEFSSLEELAMTVNVRRDTGQEPSCAIFILYAHAGLLEVLPQHWFTDTKTDTGYQWITRVGRDPVTHRLIGDGIRISPFCLTEDGKNLETLLS
ncbi:MAG TPA: hypothetical protein VN577_01125 [Terriglobales bacterium]|nr:hypothetical protein [Terriglobales bacterium]